MRTIVLGMILLFLSAGAMAQTPAVTGIQLGNHWRIEAGWNIPLAKMFESFEPGVKLDVESIIGFGGGPAFNWENAEHKAAVSIVPVMLILSARTDGSDKLNASVGPVLGILDNALQAGCLYYLGKLDQPRSRFEIVFSIGPGLIKSVVNKF